jgi:hypothetical protein
VSGSKKTFVVWKLGVDNIISWTCNSPIMIQKSILEVEVISSWFSFKATNLTRVFHVPRDVTNVFDKRLNYMIVNNVYNETSLDLG